MATIRFLACCFALSMASPAWAQTVSGATAATTSPSPYPCESSAEHRYFDFWLGEWEVSVAGKAVGNNSITLAPGGCAIHESYVTPGPYRGQSINFFDPIDKKWHQHWVGSGGDVYNYVEIARADGMLQFQSRFMTAQGTVVLSRLTFTLNADGTVRQLFETSSDAGTSWKSNFDGLYRRKF